MGLIKWYPKNPKNKKLLKLSVISETIIKKKKKNKGFHKKFKGSWHIGKWWPFSKFTKWVLKSHEKITEGSPLKIVYKIPIVPMIKYDHTLYKLGKYWWKITQLGRIGEHFHDISYPAMKEVISLKLWFLLAKKYNMK